MPDVQKHLTEQGYVNSIDNNGDDNNRKNGYEQTGCCSAAIAAAGWKI